MDFKGLRIKCYAIGTLFNITEMHASIIEHPDRISLFVFEGKSSQRLDFKVDYWEKDMLNKLIVSFEQRRYSVVSAGPQLRVYVGQCEMDWYLWVRAGDGYVGTISLTEEVKTALREIDRLMVVKHYPKRNVQTC